MQRSLLGLWYGCDEEEKRCAVALWGSGRQLAWASKVLSTKLRKRKVGVDDGCGWEVREKKRRSSEARSAKRLQGWIGYTGGKTGKY